jgi:hypothetical protein
MIDVETYDIGASKLRLVLRVVNSLVFKLYRGICSLFDVAWERGQCITLVARIDIRDACEESHEVALDSWFLIP